MAVYTTFVKDKAITFDATLAAVITTLNADVTKQLVDIKFTSHVNYSGKEVYSAIIISKDVAEP